MDIYEATRILLSRIQSLDPENANKIIGLLLLQDNGDKELIRLALGPQSLLHSLVLKAHKQLGLMSPVLSGSTRAHDQMGLDSICDGSSNEFSPYGWNPCFYFARGFCKNGSSCRFVHGLQEDLNVGNIDGSMDQMCHDLIMRSTQSKCFDLLVQQHENQRIAAMARARLDPSATQIYLTFPAESTFREEDVSNYFSMYGPVQDVRIPYQQKRMFGFVSFVYPETVKLILAKGNPHFVCDSRVLVKPYKEKGKVSEKKQQQQGERVEFSCTTPTGLNLDSRGDALDFQQLGTKMNFNTNCEYELMLRRKLEERQQAAEFQKAIELQQRRFMGLKLLDLKNRSIATAPVPINNAIVSAIDSSSCGSLESSSPEEIPLNGAALMDNKVNDCNDIIQDTTFVVDKQECNEEDPRDDGDYQESFGHNLPDSPFASPKKSGAISNLFTASKVDVATNMFGVHNGDLSFGHKLTSSKIQPTSTDDTTLKSGYFHMPRFPDDGAIGM